MQAKKPTLLLHSCCAPCSSYVLEYLHSFFDITLYFYNPNISPESEYAYRAQELERLVKEMGFSDSVKIIVPDYTPEEFENIAKGKESEPERGRRCTDCYYIRLKKSFDYAEKNGFDYFSTTLSISPHKDAQRLNEIGASLTENTKTKWLYSDFKKNNGYIRSIELSEKYNLYRQNYCGCKYSKR
ncbi:MAG: epoxyqueuosine reductase QueH [Clostridia bacterium]|nr:epoxyqueuosine reductase QueH [Clostridia bacterium]